MVADLENEQVSSPEKGREIVYSSPILSRSGLFLPKRRTLVLTDLPRLLCFKEDLIKQKIKVKSECVFDKANEQTPPAAGGRMEQKRDGSPSPLLIPRTVTNVLAKGPRAFIVRL